MIDMHNIFEKIFDLIIPNYKKLRMYKNKLNNFSLRFDEMNVELLNNKKQKETEDFEHLENINNLQKLIEKNNEIIELYKNESALKDDEIENLKDGIKGLENNIDVLLENEDEFERVYSDILIELQLQYQYLTDKTKSGFFADNPEIKEIADFFDKVKKNIFILIKNNFNIENIDELTKNISQYDEKNVIEKQMIIDLSPKEVIAVHGSRDPKNDRGNSKFDVRKFYGLNGDEMKK